MTRREQREATFALLFEKDFKKDELAEEVFAVSTENREIDSVNDKFISTIYFGVCQNQEEIDALIEQSSNGWKVYRLSNSTRAILRLATYELIYTDTPENIIINEAIELAKKYDDEKASPFINGVLNTIKDKNLRKNG